MTTAFDDSFHKITRTEDLPPGVPTEFHAAGATIVLLRDGDRIEATDGSAEAGAAARRLRVRVEGGEVWVCLEGCRPASG